MGSWSFIHIAKAYQVGTTGRVDQYILKIKCGGGLLPPLPHSLEYFKRRKNVQNLYFESLNVDKRFFKYCF